MTITIIEHVDGVTTALTETFTPNVDHYIFSTLPGTGIAAVQAWSDKRLGVALLEHIAGGSEPSEAMRDVQHGDSAKWQQRQIAFAGPAGTVLHTGAHCVPFAEQARIAEDDWTAVFAGNFMANTGTTDRMADTWRTLSTHAPVDRLLRVMRVAEHHGGDLRKVTTSGALRQCDASRVTVAQVNFTEHNDVLDRLAEMPLLPPKDRREANAADTWYELERQQVARRWSGDIPGSLDTLLHMRDLIGAGIPSVLGADVVASIVVRATEAENPEMAWDALRRLKADHDPVWLQVLWRTGH